MKKTLDQQLIGQWQGPTGMIELHGDHTGVVNGEATVWSVENKILTLAGQSGVLQFPYQVTEPILTWFSNGQPAVVFQRRKPHAVQPEFGSIMAGLAGKWSYLGGVTTYGGTTSSTASLLLNADGTYESESEYSANGTAYAGYGMASQNSDSGRWRATETTLTLDSATQGSRTFALQKVNHPQNGDPMIVLDGQAYVTCFQKPAWR